MSIDPLAEKFPNTSSYVYCLNNPILYIDPDGRDPIITITNQVVGWGHIKLIGADNRGSNNSYVTIGVPLYKVVITDDEDSNFRMETMVSRDSWIVKNIDGNNASIVNGAFEPKDAKNNEYDGVYNAPYPHDNDTAGYALEQNGETVLNSEPRYNSKGELVGDASSIMIHVGGYYYNEKDATNNDKPRTRAGGSLGCFGIFNKNNSIKNPSDKESKRVINGVRSQSDEDSYFGYSNVKIIIQKRDNVERTKEVVLPQQ
ncbi:hypothetical protein V8245_00890 [Flavobacterium columnare]|uniref:hypothetical protein n=1 Tax=Flavobacterium columnare TaxID=996 RepID=UPI003C2FAC24